MKEFSSTKNIVHLADYAKTENEYIKYNL